MTSQTKEPTREERDLPGPINPCGGSYWKGTTLAPIPMQYARACLDVTINLVLHPLRIQATCLHYVHIQRTRSTHTSSAFPIASLAARLDVWFNLVCGPILQLITDSKQSDVKTNKRGIAKHPNRCEKTVRITSWTCRNRQTQPVRVCYCNPIRFKRLISLKVHPGWGGQRSFDRAVNQTSIASSSHRWPISAK